jgi:hypothetical protein
MLRLNIRIKRKRRALEIIIGFCKESKKNQSKSSTVRKFFIAVKIIQRYIKTVISKIKAQIEIVEIIWNKIEHLYLARNIEEINQRKKREKKLKPIEAFKLINKSSLDRSSKLIMNNQQYKWEEIDSKSEEVLYYFFCLYCIDLGHCEIENETSIKNSYN